MASSLFKWTTATGNGAGSAAAILPLLRMGSPVLRSNSRPWAKDEIVSSDARSLVRDMTATMRSSQGIGLAAPQVGVGKQLLLIHLPPDPDLPRLQRLVGRVWRHRHVLVDYVDEEGREQRLEASEFIAAMLQHEIDHLHATLFVDRVKPGDLYFQDEFDRHYRPAHEEGPPEGTIRFFGPNPA